MAIPTSGYPTTLDDTNATPGAGVEFPQPGSSTDLDATNVEHDLLHTNLSLAIVALQTKLGITDSNAAADKLLIGSGASTTAWTSTLPTVGFGTDGSGVDVTWYSDTAGDTMLWDSSEEKLILEGTNGATVLDITDGNVVIGDGTLTVGSDGAGEDVTFYSDTSGDHMVWDSSAEKLTITGTDSQTALDIPDGNVTITDDLTVTGTTQTYLNVITDSTTTRTPALTDASAYILTTHGTGITVTLPQDSAVAFPTGSSIVFERNGAGTLTFAAGAGATVNSKDATLTCADRYTTVAAVKIAADTWTIFGNIG